MIGSAAGAITRPAVFTAPEPPKLPVARNITVPAIEIADPTHVRIDPAVTIALLCRVVTRLPSVRTISSRRRRTGLPSLTRAAGTGSQASAAGSTVYTCDTVQPAN